MLSLVPLIQPEIRLQIAGILPADLIIQGQVAPTEFPVLPILLVLAILIPLMIVAFQKFTNK